LKPTNESLPSFIQGGKSMTEKKIILADEPLKSPDQDKLGFAPFAKRIATVIQSVQLRESIVFAVYGKWGSGKTTFINFLTSYLNHDSSITIVKFDPWWFSEKEDLIRQFLSNLQFTLNKSTKFKDIAKMLKPYIETLGEIPKFGWIFKIASRFKKNLQKSVIETKEEIINRLKEKDGKIVVIIDDIDRLTAKEIRELFTIVKAIADFPNTVYILAFDKDIVIRALEKVQEGKGEDYLEKIIQIPIELPLADKTSIRKMLFEELDAVLSGTSNELFDSTYWRNVYWDGIDPFINTVRNVKRLINTIRVTYPSVKNEVNAVDFIAIETLRVFCPEVYSIVKDYPDMFCGYSGEIYDVSRRHIEFLKQFHQNWLSRLNFPDDLKENIKNLLKRLFPKFESVFENIYYGPDWEREWRKKYRICCKEIFPRFFIFSVPSDDLSKHEMDFILSSLHNKEALIEHLKRLATQIRSDGSTRLSIFLERMEDYASEISQDYIPVVIEVFFTIGDKLIIPEDENKSFLIPWGNDIRMERIIWRLLRRYDNNSKRFEVLKNAFKNGQALFMMVNVLILFWQQHRKYRDAKESDAILLDENHLKTLQEIVLDKIRKAVEEGSLLNTPSLPVILHQWREWANEDEVKEWVKEIVFSDEKLPIFLTKFLQKTVSWTETSRATNIYWQIDLNWLKDFINLDFLEKRCNEILSNDSIIGTLEDKQKLAIRLFLNEKTKSLDSSTEEQGKDG